MKIRVDQILIKKKKETIETNKISNRVAATLNKIGRDLLDRDRIGENVRLISIDAFTFYTRH